MEQEQQKTVFIRNIPFDCEEEDFKQFLEESFGKLEYCLFCKDKDTGEMKGTGFAKFVDSETYSECLEQFRNKDFQTKFHYDGRNLMFLPALSRDRLSQVKEKKPKDKRNIKLIYVSRIKPEEENGMSKEDLEFRKILEQRKQESLKNLHKFVSDTRLCIHNLLPSIDDKRLRKIVLTANPQAKVLECRVMKNKNKTGKLGKSKGFAFIQCKQHEQSLAILQSLNNNPKIFTDKRRPIVEFSIENSIALKKKEKTKMNSQSKKIDKKTKITKT